MKLANIQMSETDLAVVLSESPRFRMVVAGLIVNTATFVQMAVDQIADLREYLVKNFNGSQRIMAIKYVRKWAVNNNYLDLKGLREAKELVDQLIPYSGS
jgi:ribosomal protein L7/L12